MNKYLKLIVIVFFLLVFTMLSYAASTTQTLMWNIPTNTSERTVWLNWTQSEYGWGLPKQVCFGLLNESVCLGGDRANVNMYNKNITNISIASINDQLCLNETCINDFSNISGRIYFADEVYINKVNQNNFTLNLTALQDDLITERNITIISAERVREIITIN